MTKFLFMKFVTCF